VDQLGGGSEDIAVIQPDRVGNGGGVLALHRPHRAGTIVVRGSGIVDDHAVPDVQLRLVRHRRILAQPTGASVRPKRILKRSFFRQL